LRGGEGVADGSADRFGFYKKSIMAKVRID
jgi:hypothetical protein